MRRAAIFLPLLLLAGCGDPVAEQTAPGDGLTDADVPPPPIVIPPLPYPSSLTGEYRVAGIDGEDPNAPFGIALSITEGQVQIEPVCAAFVWSYAYDEGKLDIERRQEKLDHPPPRVCDKPAPSEIQRLASALDAVDAARITPSNGIELSGHGRSVLLFTQ